jgi:hypothetical protein
VWSGTSLNRCVGFGVWGLGFGVWVLGFGVWGLGFGVWVVFFRIWILGFGFWVLGFGIWGKPQLHVHLTRSRVALLDLIRYLI